MSAISLKVTPTHAAGKPNLRYSTDSRTPAGSTAKTFKHHLNKVAQRNHTEYYLTSKHVNLSLA